MDIKSISTKAFWLWAFAELAGFVWMMKAGWGIAPQTLLLFYIYVQCHNLRTKGKALHHNTATLLSESVGAADSMQRWKQLWASRSSSSQSCWWAKAPTINTRVIIILPEQKVTQDNFLGSSWEKATRLEEIVTEAKGVNRSQE